MPKTMNELIRTLSPLRMAPNSPDTDRCVALLCEELPFVVREFAAGTELNGWIVPQSWYPVRATIHDASGNLVYDGMHHPLAVIGYGQSFKGEVSAEELKKHLFFTDKYDDALVYHCDLFYKPFRKEWGFSVPKKLVDTLPDGRYTVDLETRFEGGAMKVAVYTLPGESTDTIVINAHNCHAFLCNDDLSGIAIGVEVMRRLAKMPKRRFTYQLVVAPEHFGSIFYLDSLKDEEAARLRWGMFLESLGSTEPIALQRSFLGNTMVDRALLNVLAHSGFAWRTELFRRVVGNDETCWEAAGYEVPFPSLSRMPFKEYHTSHDGPDLMKDDKLEEAATVVMDALFVLETDSVMTRKFKGLVALSHPRYDLYKPMLDPSEPDRRVITDKQRRWNYLMDCLPRYFDGKTRILEIAERHELSYRSVYDYVKAFEEKGLVDMTLAPAENPAPRALPPF